METSPDIRDRINFAADALYEESGRRSVPTVDAVRKLAKVNINDASNCMRDWRRAHATRSATPKVQVPEKLQQSSLSALSALWTEAVDLCSETLRMAQAGWDAERADSAALNAQIAAACKSQEDELLAAQSEIDKQAKELVRLNLALAAAQGRADEAGNLVRELRADVSHLEGRSIEIGRRADDLRQALDQAHASHAATYGEQTVLIRTQADQLDRLRSELADVRQRSESSGAAFRAELTNAVEETARLNGKLGAMEEAREHHSTRSPSPQGRDLNNGQ